MQQEEHARSDNPEQTQSSTPQVPPTKTTTEATASSATEKDYGSAGIVGIIILILAIALGGLYFWSMNSEVPGTEEPAPITEPETDPVVESMMQLENSTELNAIERDLDRTDVDSIDGDFDEFKTEFEAEAQ